MRAIAYVVTGSATDVLRLVDLPVLEPSPDEVRVKIVVSGVNPTDWKSRSAPGPLPFELIVPNQDGAGTIDAVGSAVTGFAVGDRVWVWDAAWQRPFGTAQEYLTIPSDQVVTLADHVSFDVGASLGIPALTAHRALTVAEGGPSRLHPGALSGATVLVAGGAGAVGHAAIQLARWAGATVISTVSGNAKGALATSAGANHVVNYREPDAADAIRAIAVVDLILEVAPAQNALLDAAVLAPNGTVAIYANNGGDEVTIPIRSSMSGNVRYQFVLTYTVPDAAKADAVAAVSAAATDGMLAVGAEAGLPLHRFRLEDTALAHQAVQDGVTGKVLVDVSAG
jgi:NADPH2:quinone reductase